ncbi:hypothetical protein [Actinophytocola sediminis]
MNIPESRLRDANWRARIWRSVDRMQHEQDNERRRAAGLASARRAQLRVVSAQPSSHNST